MYVCSFVLFIFFFSSRRRHTRCALVTGVQTCALPISEGIVVAERAEHRLHAIEVVGTYLGAAQDRRLLDQVPAQELVDAAHDLRRLDADADAAQRSEEHTSELQSLMRTSYAVFCLEKKNKQEL